MKKIPLTQGKFALVDDEDYDYLMQWKWHAIRAKATFYAVRSVYIKGKRCRIRMHRVILKTPVGLLTDHRDHNGLNNTRGNLRVATKSQNAMNSVCRSNSISGYKGVVWRKDRAKWTAQIFMNRKGLRLGAFTCPMQAAKAYDKKARELFGEYARTNFGN